MTGGKYHRVALNPLSVRKVRGHKPLSLIAATREFALVKTPDERPQQGLISHRQVHPDRDYRSHGQSQGHIVEQRAKHAAIKQGNQPDDDPADRLLRVV